MNLSDALYFLDTNAKVSCPEITAQQAKELAELVRWLHETHYIAMDEIREAQVGEADIKEILEEVRTALGTPESVSLLSHAKEVAKERDEARAEVERAHAAHRATTAAMVEDVARANAAIAEARQLRAEVERLRGVPVCHCLVCVHAREGDVEVDASDYEKPRRK